MEWQLAEAKNRFSELVTRALTEGPQRVTRRNDTVVIIAEKEYDRLHGKEMSFKDFLTSAPDMTGMEFKRDQNPMRDIDFGGAEE